MDKSIYEVTKQIALIVAGAYIGITVIPYEDQVTENLLLILIILILLTLYGIGLVEWISHLLYWLVRKINQKFRYVCIYAPYALEEGNSSWVNVSFESILNIFSTNSIPYRIGKFEGVLKEYPVVLNPYGGVYPEENASTLRSMNKIFRYVQDGGVYINIADIPFYYAYDRNLERRVDTTPLAGDFTMARSFLATILTKRLNHYVFGLTTGKDFNEGIARIIQLSETSENLYIKDEFDDGPQKGYTPVLKIPYGKGYFIFSTLSINHENLEENLMRVTKSALS